MKFCPNPECPFALRHAQPAEYVDLAEACTDCGASLSSTPPPSVALGRGVFNPPWSRLAVTLLAGLVPFLLPYFALPGLNVDGTATQDVLTSDATRVSPFALGIGPFIWSFGCVEIVALVVPRWRHLRIGGPTGRARLLSAVRQLAYAVCILQAFALTVYLERLEILESGRLVRLAAILSVVAGTLLLVLFSQLLDGHGLGGGFSVMYAAFFLPQLTSSAFSLNYRAQVWPKGIDLAVLILVAVVIGSTVVLRWRFRNAGGSASPIRLPACGVVPLVFTASLFSSVAVLGVYLRHQPLQALLGHGMGIIGSVALCFLFSLVFGALFNDRSRVWAARANPGSPAGHTLEDAKVAVTKAILVSAVFIVALQLIEHLVGATFDDLPLIGVVPLVMFAAVGLDVREEFKAFREHGELVAVWPEHRVYAVDKALMALERAGIPAFPRGIHHRTLWHFFAPFIPVDIMVPRSRSEEAGAILRTVLLEPAAPGISAEVR